MPEMDGYELSRRIRKLESEQGRRRIPIIACTANVLRGEAEICLAAGMDDYLAKPVQLSELGEKLHRWLPVEAPFAGPPEMSDERSGTPVSSPAGAGPIDRTVLSEITGGAALSERTILADFRHANDADAATLEPPYRCSRVRRRTRRSPWTCGN